MHEYNSLHELSESSFVALEYCSMWRVCVCGGGRMVCAGGVCSAHNWIRLNAADVACQLNLYELHIIA